MSHSELSSDDRALLRDALKVMLCRIWPPERAVANASESAALIGLWSELCANGIAGFASPSDVAMAMAETGRAAAPSPLIGACIARHALCDQPAFASFVEGITTGEIRIAVAFGVHDGDPAAGSALVAGNIIHGWLGAIEDWPIATHLLVLTDHGESAALVKRNATGLTATLTPGFAVPPLARIVLNRCACTPVRLAAGGVARFVDLARLMLAARATGAARRALELAVAYVQVREQFGQPIGRFQALQHKLADCAVTLDAVELMIANAATAQAADGRFETTALFALASPGLRRVALELHHSFGAIGYAEEHELPRHFRRIHADMARLGGALHARLALGRQLLGRSQSQAMFAPLATHAAAERFRAEVRTWLSEHWNAAARAEARTRPFAVRDSDAQFVRLLGQRNWLAINWPRAFGGLGLSPLEQLAFVEEMHRCGAPIALAQAGSWLIGPALIRFGTLAQRQELLPMIQRGDARLCLGYSEPQAGSDLASLRTRAVRDGADFVITGQKLWTTRAETATHVFLAARTDPQTQPKHAGISLFIVPLNSPGIRIHPGMALYGRTFSTVFYDEVRVPATCLVGELNGGWQVLTSALASERVLMGGSVAKMSDLLERIIRALQKRPANDVLADRLGGLAAELHAARLLALRSVQLIEQEASTVLEGAISKLFSGDLAERIGETAIELFGVEATLSEDSGGVPLDGAIEQHLRASIMAVIGGGTAEIQRSMIAQRGLGLPR